MVKYTNQQANLIISHAVAVHEARYGKRKEYEIAELINVDPSVFSKAKGNCADKRYLQDHHLNELVEEYGKPYGMSKGRYIISEKCTDAKQFCEAYQNINDSHLAKELLEKWIDADIDRYLVRSFSIYEEEEEQIDALSYIKTKLCELIGGEEFQAWYKDHDEIEIADLYICDPSDDECKLKEILRTHNLETSRSYAEIIIFEWLGYLAYEHRGIELFAFEDTRYKTEFPSNQEYVICGENIATFSITLKPDSQYSELVEQYKTLIEFPDYTIPEISPDEVPRLHDGELKIYKTDNNNYYCNIQLQVGSKIRNMVK